MFKVHQELQNISLYSLIYKTYLDIQFLKKIQYYTIIFYIYVLYNLYIVCIFVFRTGIKAHA